MSKERIAKLDDYIEEEIFEIVGKLEKSFGIKFERTTFINVKTFGELCDVFGQHITGQNKDDCTRQQAFYKVRKAISKTVHLDEKRIVPGDNLGLLFPHANRRRKIKEFENYLGASADILIYPRWMNLAFTICSIISFIVFFFDWRIAVSGIVLCVLTTKVAAKLGKSLTVQTVRQLTDKLTSENYAQMRRATGTVNKKEVLPVIADVFSDNLGVDKIHLTKNAKFRWAKNTSERKH